MAAAPIKFYTDTHIAKAVADQLRAQGVDIVRCEDGANQVIYVG